MIALTKQRFRSAASQSSKKKKKKKPKKGRKIHVGLNAHKHSGHVEHGDPRDDYALEKSKSSHSNTQSTDHNSLDKHQTLESVPDVFTTSAWRSLSTGITNAATDTDSYEVTAALSEIKYETTRRATFLNQLGKSGKNKIIGFRKRKHIQHELHCISQRIAYLTEKIRLERIRKPSAGVSSFSRLLKGGLGQKCEVLKTGHVFVMKSGDCRFICNGCGRGEVFPSNGKSATYADQVDERKYVYERKKNFRTSANAYHEKFIGVCDWYLPALRKEWMNTGPKRDVDIKKCEVIRIGERLGIPNIKKHAHRATMLLNGSTMVSFTTEQIDILVYLFVLIQPGYLELREKIRTEIHSMTTNNKSSSSSLWRVDDKKSKVRQKRKGTKLDDFEDEEDEEDDQEFSNDPSIQMMNEKCPQVTFFNFKWCVNKFSRILEWYDVQENFHLNNDSHIQQQRDHAWKFVMDRSGLPFYRSF